MSTVWSLTNLSASLLALSCLSSLLIVLNTLQFTDVEYPCWEPPVFNQTWIVCGLEWEAQGAKWWSKIMRHEGLQSAPQNGHVPKTSIVPYKQAGSSMCDVQYNHKWEWWSIGGNEQFSFCIIKGGDKWNIHKMICCFNIHRNELYIREHIFMWSTLEATD